MIKDYRFAQLRAWAALSLYVDVRYAYTIDHRPLKQKSRWEKVKESQVYIPGVIYNIVTNNRHILGHINTIRGEIIRKQRIYSSLSYHSTVSCTPNVFLKIFSWMTIVDFFLYDHDQCFFEMLPNFSANCVTLQI